MSGASLASLEILSEVPERHLSGLSFHSAGCLGTAPEVPWDVFISHRGKDAERGSDTKWGFVSFLHSRLAREGVRTFMDERELHPGAACQDAWSNMLAALRKCRIALPVLHESYGSSKWCLHELACMVTAKRVIMPVFLSKEGTDVLHALRNGAESLRAQVKKVEADEWLAAIGAVGKATGWRLDQYDGYVLFPTPQSYCPKNGVRLMVPTNCC